MQLIAPPRLPHPHSNSDQAKLQIVQYLLYYTTTDRILKFSPSAFTLYIRLCKRERKLTLYSNCTSAVLFCVSKDYVYDLVIFDMSMP